MTSYTPDIGDIRDDYIIENTRGHDSFLTGRSLKDERGVYGSRFDNFIRKVQADAWDEGFESALWDKNPYRN